MKSALARVSACLLTVCSLLGMAVVTATPAAAAECNGTVTTSGPVDIGISAYTTEAYVCFDVAGARRIVGVRGLETTGTITETFDCVNPGGGTIGDPSDPPSVDYRYAVDSYRDVTTPHVWVIVCVEVNGVARSVSFLTAPDPEVVLETPAPGGDAVCGDSGTSESVTVNGSAIGSPDYQRVQAGTSGNDVCLGTDGVVECTILAPHVQAGDLSACPALAGIDELVEDAVDDVVTFVDETIDPFEDDIERLREDVDELIEPVVDAVFAEVARAIVLVEETIDLLPVSTGTDLGSCSVSVASNSTAGIDVRRSPTGQVPASVCVVRNGTVRRVTVG